MPGDSVEKNYGPTSFLRGYCCVYFRVDILEQSGMAKNNPGIEAYISKAEPFAQHVLNHLRTLVHDVCPDVEEKLKWGMPHFDYRGSMMCSMAAFKQHCAFGFWKASVMQDPKGLFEPQAGMGHFGRITSLKDLPPDKTIASYIREAMKLNDAGVKLKSPSKSKQKKSIEMPEFFTNALQRNKTAKQYFEAFTPSKQKDYIEWLAGAKTEATREKRLETAMGWISEGKPRHWKYAK